MSDELKSSKQERLEIYSLVDKEDFLSRFDYFYERWLDESEYENIEDYQEPMQKLFNDYYKGMKIICMNKRPFGCLFKFKDATIKIGRTQKTISIDLIKLS